MMSVFCGDKFYFLRRRISFSATHKFIFCEQIFKIAWFSAIANLPALWPWHTKRFMYFTKNSICLKICVKNQINAVWVTSWISIQQSFITFIQKIQFHSSSGLSVFRDSVKSVKMYRTEYPIFVKSTKRHGLKQKNVEDGQKMDSATCRGTFQIPRKMPDFAIFADFAELWETDSPSHMFL